MARGELATSLLVYGEVVEYLRGLGLDYERYRTGLLDLLAAVHPYVLALRITERYADVHRAMRRPDGAGLIGDVDTLIAATAMQHGLTVVTPDAHFERCPAWRCSA